MKLEALFTGPLSILFKWRILFLAMCSLLTSPSLSISEPWNFHKAGDINPTEFLGISSDEEATAVFRKSFGKAIGLNPPPSRKVPPNSQAALLKEEVLDEITYFMAQVIISIRTSQFETGFQGGIAQLPFPLPDKDTPQSQWLLSKDGSKDYLKFLDLSAGIISLSQEQRGESLQPPPHFSAFASHFDHTYPYLVNGQDSWISLLKTQGTEAIPNRFKEYWENPSIQTSSQEPSPAIPPDQRSEYQHYYLKTRLLPVFSSYLIAQSIQLHANAEQYAEQSWLRLRKWNETDQQTRALTRLCGKWQWTVHNHQNHQDHKMTLFFSPLPSQIPGQPEPDVIIMNGDTVYLKWTFPKGYQEDSLLLSNRDQRLEGTFRNSRGPHGNISGKRLSTCRP